MKNKQSFNDLKHYSACCYCQYYIDEKCSNKKDCVWSDIEKELKVLEIIKERRCNVADFIVDNPNWEEVTKDYEYWFSEMPTKEEYDLLKSVL